MKDHLIRSINAIQLYSSIIIKLELTFLSINKEMCSLQYCPQFLNSLNYLSRKLSKTAFNQSQYKIKNMSQQIQQHYKINMKDSIQNTSTDIKIIINKLKSRWAFENIFKERNIVTNMNCKLEVTLKCLKKCDLLKTVGDRQIASIIGNIPFLQRVEGQGGQSKVPTWRFCYSYPQSVLIVTGICSLSLKQQLQKYVQLSSKHHKGDDKRKKAVVTILHEGFFTMIDAETKENAQLLKGFLRTNKKYLQERRRADFKQDNRRIRIMRFHEEDLFSFIIDIMTEYKAQIFTKSMDQDLSLTMKQRCQPRVRKTDQIFYKPFSIRSLQNNAYFWSSSQPQERQQEVEDQNSEDYQEFYSITSLNSQVDESKNLDFGQVIDKFSQSTSLSYQQLIESEERNNE